MLHAAEVAAGAPFVVKLTLQSFSAQLQTLEVALKDSAGFVTSGELPHLLKFCLSVRGVIERSLSVAMR